MKKFCVTEEVRCDRTLDKMDADGDSAPVMMYDGNVIVLGCKLGALCSRLESWNL